jgi:hypothetical protein
MVLSQHTMLQTMRHRPNDSVYIFTHKILHIEVFYIRTTHIHFAALQFTKIHAPHDALRHTGHCAQTFACGDAPRAQHAQRPSDRSKTDDIANRVYCMDRIDKLDGATAVFTRQRRACPTTSIASRLRRRHCQSGWSCPKATCRQGLRQNPLGDAF